MDRLTSFK
ncbi:hypothetical protein F383_38340 [Gossypium arboreum]|uniref:Uncharacterized protein n=1 Tax=Gossypium arboreum TaxID=29729 RepID=A0A0B0MIZ3_GOSAR|nr:hypothetical protein F383_38340 [Gossypium arboreum]